MNMSICTFNNVNSMVNAPLTQHDESAHVIYCPRGFPILTKMSIWYCKHTIMMHVPLLAAHVYCEIIIIIIIIAIIIKIINHKNKDGIIKV